MSIAPQRPFKSVSGVRNIAVSFSEMLDANELLSGTPVITEVINSSSPNTDLTITSKVISTAVLTINNISVPIAEAVQFTVTGGLTANSPYSITISIGTTASQTLIGTVVLTVIPDA